MGLTYADTTNNVLADDQGTSVYTALKLYYALQYRIPFKLYLITTAAIKNQYRQKNLKKN